jgi:hypothetical protein
VEEKDIPNLPAILAAISLECIDADASVAADPEPAAPASARSNPLRHFMPRKLPSSGLLPGSRATCVPKLQAELACALRFFLWSSVYGSVFGEGGDLDAFAMTMLALQEKLATWVNREPTKRLNIHSACFVASHMGCIHVTPQPVCRNPCKGVRLALWPLPDHRSLGMISEELTDSKGADTTGAQI